MALIGSVALAAVLFKFSSVKHVIAATGAKASPTGAAYGNSTYGGNTA